MSHRRKFPSAYVPSHRELEECLEVVLVPVDGTPDAIMLSWTEEDGQRVDDDERDSTIYLPISDVPTLANWLVDALLIVDPCLAGDVENIENILWEILRNAIARLEAVDD